MGEAVTIGKNYVCVGFYEEFESRYWVWEWHGHVILFDVENGWNIFMGNYFERING